MDALGGDSVREQGIETDLAARRDERAAIVPEVDEELLEPTTCGTEARRRRRRDRRRRLPGLSREASAVELDRLKRTDGVKRCEYCRRIVVLA